MTLKETHDVEPPTRRWWDITNHTFLSPCHSTKEGKINIFHAWSHDPEIELFLEGLTRANDFEHCTLKEEIKIKCTLSYIWIFHDHMNEYASNHRLCSQYFLVVIFLGLINHVLPLECIKKLWSLFNHSISWIFWYLN